MREDVGGMKGRVVTLSWKNAVKIYMLSLFFQKCRRECPMVNFMTTPGQTGQDEGHVASHFCYMSSNKPNEVQFPLG